VRIVCLNQDPGIGPQRKKGAAVHLAAMRAAFAELGAQVTALDASDESQVQSGLEAARSDGPLDLVYERYALGKDRAARFCREHGIPLAVEVNAPLAEEEARYRDGKPDPAATERDRNLFSAAVCVTAVTSEVARYAVERGADPARVHVFPNGVDTRRFRPRAPDDPLRAGLVPAGRFALGFHGRLRPWHGFGLFVRATEELLRLGDSVHLVLVGEGDFDQELRGRIDAGRVSRIGWVDHAAMGPYVASFDALPLTYDPAAPCYFSPLKLAEAMACGVVPVLPRLGDLARAVTDGIDGLFYEPGDLNALVAALHGLIHDEPRRAALASAAVASAQRMSWGQIAAFVLENTTGTSGNEVAR